MDWFCQTRSSLPLPVKSPVATICQPEETLYLIDRVPFTPEQETAAGLTPEGTTEATLEESEIKQALADVSNEVVLAVDHTKLGRIGVARCLPLDRIDILVTDLDPEDERLHPYTSIVTVL